MMFRIPALTPLCLSLAGAVAIPSLTGCGGETGLVGVVVPPESPPTIRNIGFSPDVQRGEFTTLSQSVFVPAGISGASNAFSLTWIPPIGQPITTNFTAAQANCLVGSLNCNSSFQPLVPPELPVVNATYDVIYTVRDQQGLSTDFLRQVFVIN